MEKINLNITHVNSDEEIVKQIKALQDDGLLKGKKGLFKVTKEIYYVLYEDSEEDLKRLAKEWFEDFDGKSHAYRDGSHFHISNLVKVEIIKE